MSFNSSDMEAYANENPIPVLKQAYLEYQRNKRKAEMRRASTLMRPMSERKQDENQVDAIDAEAGPGSARVSKNHLNDSFCSDSSGRHSEVKLILQEQERTVYDNPNKKIIMALEPGNELIMEVTETLETGADKVYQAYQTAEDGLRDAAGTAMQGVNIIADYSQQLGLFVPKLRVVEDVDKFRYDVKDNRSIQTVAVARVFRKSGKYIFQLGIVNFLELTIINLFLLIHCFKREAEIYADASGKDESVRQLELPYLRTHVSQFAPAITLTSLFL